ncbi:MAG: tyrosine-type recombinase/integrase [Moritella sp.]|uniref:tyrosine-type recombinase/integrase n=1 Tax=Moritella sp. TaxID=78556 RepID=UPI001D1C0046|nr:tyrosine-type recombinase/integrase [Moritella sp.]NQY66793.1 tyrosine-type recombinase/integrase [Flavobacteriales bacterium]NQZ51909.1 tyrosine-type recombinase/integrase [Moritella sp.]
MERIKDFENWLIRLGYAETTIKSYTRLLENFFNYLEIACGGSPPNQQRIEQFNKHLHQSKVSRSYISAHINIINRYSEFLELTTKEKLTVGKILVEREITTERTIFTQSEMKLLFSSIEGNTPQGLFDKALLSIYYGCGLRSKEGINLVPQEVDFNKGLLYVKPSKNYSSRYVPISQGVLAAIKDYMNYARSIINPNSKYLLVGKQQPKVNGHYLNTRLKKLQEKAGITKNASLHSLRHSIATHLLQQGMELEYIGSFLGHKRLDSTQVYVRINEELMYNKH